MYYLDCVLIVIEYDRNSRLTDYKHYYNLNNDEKKAVIQLAILFFNPKIFIDAGIFVVNSDLLPDSSGNKFFKITDETIGVHVNQQVVIGGRTVKVLNIMACNSAWINRNYINPLERIRNEARIRSLPTQQNYPVVNSETRVIPYNQAVVVNQSTPAVIRTYEFGSSQTLFCRCAVTTNTECEFNCGSCCLCLLTGCLCFMCIQLCRGKSICCNDTIHKCPNCGHILGRYSSC